LKSLSPFSLAGNVSRQAVTTCFVVGGIESLMVVYPQNYLSGNSLALTPQFFVRGFQQVEKGD